MNTFRFKYTTLFLTVLLLTGTASTVFAQSFTMTTSENRDKASYSYLNERWPEKMMLFGFERDRKEIDIDAVTLIQVWSACCGAEPYLWEQLEAINEEFKPKGLKWVSINFENGTAYDDQVEIIQEYFKKNKKPEHFYLDPMGSTISKLKVHGFPTYFLVSKEGRLVFTTNGKDNDGMALLQAELEKMLN
ncbi:TlpA family protein disulfide reductase [Sulfidibacter corallicola]|uniref:TlpA family protein disulfide reductase n=1 Tax=Sulfidibacter corallicola TaxID=2818388 RepID=A0A8A4TTB3_SULCO|nr:TlpA disulfide reductase family protein [Sulfidibacter corallicola]QTD53199.1 TlpA family protein disulfide reductase [Sulfidibacter corallicola]